MKWILLLGILFLLPIAFAGNEFGKLTSGGDLLVVDVDVKVDGLTSRNLEFGDEITRTAKPSSVIIFEIELKNNNTDLEMTDVEMVVEIEELELEEITSQIDLSSNRDKVLTVTFTLPSDTEERDYEVFIEAEGELNNTIHRVEYELELIVEIPDEEKETSISSGSTLTQKIESISQNLTEISKSIGSYFEPYSECNSERSSLKTALEEKETQLLTLSGIQTTYNICVTDRDNCNVLKTEYKLANETCYSLVVEGIIEDSDRKNSRWIITLIIVVVLGGLYINREKLWQFKKGEGEKGAEEP